MSEIAVLLPCFNEELTIAKVIRDFRQVLPEAKIYVYDNNSTDRSVELATAENAIIRKVSRQGKGFVVRQMFQDIDADCYILVDSDDTYPAEDARKLMEPVLSGEADMVCGDRLSTTYFEKNQRKFHNFGNKLVCTLIRLFFRKKVVDVMTGYRVFSRRFVKNYPVLCSGFELETEMTVFTLDLRLNLIEIPINYRNRPEGSHSKLHTFRDGFNVLKTIFLMLKNYRPLFTFGILGLLQLAVAAGFFIPVFLDFLQTGLVKRFPTLICSVFLAGSGLLFIFCGMILQTVKYYFDRSLELSLKR